MSESDMETSDSEFQSDTDSDREVNLLKNKKQNKIFNL